MDELDNRLKKYYGQVSPDADLTRTLAQKAEEAQNSGLGTQKVLGRMTYPRMAAVIILLISLGGGIFMLKGSKGRKVAKAYAEEIALNHNKDLPPEIITTEYFAINEQLPKLDFKVVGSGKAHGTLLGARYCSIGESIAAQLKMGDKLGNVYTFYQFKKDQDIKLPKESIFEIGNVEVMIWEEAGLVMGFAGEI